MSGAPPRRVLFVAYQFPPVGGVGVHRATKFVKYLPEFGWQSSVLTVSNPSVPLLDESLLQDIPNGTIIRRAKTREPGYRLKSTVSGSKAAASSRWSPSRTLKTLARSVANTVLQPDSQILWHRDAYRQATQLLSDVPHAAIVATGPPFSSFLLGTRLGQWSGLPLILDYRDEWDISNAYWENKGHNWFSNWIQNRQQARAVRQADVLLATTPASAAAVGEVADRAGSQARTAYIYNGFDPDDYPNVDSIKKQDYGHGTTRFRLSFIGTLWNLNSIAPIVRGLTKLAAQNRALASELELLVVGRRTEDQEKILADLEGTPIALTKLPFVSHSEAIQLMQSSDSLLMLNSDVPKAQRIINAKVFEYMAARRPMFVVAPEGDVWDVVRPLPGTVLCRPSETDTIADQLAMLIEQHRVGFNYSGAVWDISRFHRRNLAGELAQLLDDTVKNCGPLLLNDRVTENHSSPSPSHQGREADE